MTMIVLKSVVLRGLVTVQSSIYIDLQATISHHDSSIFPRKSLEAQHYSEVIAG